MQQLPTTHPINPVMTQQIITSLYCFCLILNIQNLQNCVSTDFGAAAENIMNKSLPSVPSQILALTRGELAHLISDMYPMLDILRKTF